MTARVYPYTGGDPGSPYFDAVPTWLNDLLLEQTPGREMRNFRLAVRKAWMADSRHACIQPMAMEEVRALLYGTSGAAHKVVQTCIDRWMDPAWPQTRKEEDRRAQQA